MERMRVPCPDKGGSVDDDGPNRRGRIVVKTVVLDDDPTGTQSATGVRVLLRWDAERLAAALAEVDAVYLQTNSRAVDEAAAVALCRRIRAEIDAAAERLRGPVEVVVRRGPTLRGAGVAANAAFVGD